MATIERFEQTIEISDFIDKYFHEKTVNQKCAECSGYAKTWSCPGFDFERIAYWKQFQSYHVICDRISLEEAETPADAEKILYAQKPIFNDEMLAKEQATPGSEALYAEECEECPRCARLDGKPCRLPQRMRYSIEALGGIGVQLVQDLWGFPVQWSDGKSVPPYYILLGGLLLK